jgi:hypothetical protein
LYTVQWVEDSSDTGNQVTVEQPIKYINHLWHTIYWSSESRTYFTDPGDILPEGFEGLGHEDHSSGPSHIPPPIEPIHEPLRTGTTFHSGILDTLAGTAVNPAEQPSPILTNPFSPTSFTPPVQSIPTPPIQVSSMSATTPIAAQSTIVAATSADKKGSLKGKQPPTFDGTRAKADNFWWAFKSIVF